jgi:hypothetical protein
LVLPHVRPGPQIGSITETFLPHAGLLIPWCMGFRVIEGPCEKNP